MHRRSLRILAVLVAATLAYIYISHIVDKQNFSQTIGIRSIAKSKCQEQPTSHCLGELAVAYLPSYNRGNWPQFNNVSQSLRLLGYDDFVATRLRQPEDDSLNRADAYRIYKILSMDLELFLNLPVHENPFVYSSIFFLLENDYPSFGGGSDIGKAEEAAYASRGGFSTTPKFKALLQTWRASLDANANSALDWLFYVPRARQIGLAEEAREALSKAMAFAVAEQNQWSVVYESWQLYGTGEALSVALAIDGTDRRSFALLNMANRLSDAGEIDQAQIFFGHFKRTYAPSGESMPSLRRSNQRSAAIAAHKLGDDAAAIALATSYAKGIPFGGASENLRDAARLYADIEATDQAIAAAYESIDRAPAPGKTVHSIFAGSWSTTVQYKGYVGGAMDVLCRLGRFEEAFALGGGDEDIGYNAVFGCHRAMSEAEPPMSIAALTEALGLRSPKVLERKHAALLVESGNYNAAAAQIRDSINTPPTSKKVPRASSNLPYLRLAIAMRDEELAREVAAAIIADSNELNSLDAAILFSDAAVLMQKWPNHGPH